MKRTLVILFFSLAFWHPAKAQLALHNSRTLFDAFENPSQKAFYTDSSKQFAFNFAFPMLSFNGSVSGSGMPALRTMLVDEVIDSRTLPLGQNKFTHISTNTNVYLLSFRWFKRVKYQQEMGFSWQIRNDSWAKASNETLALFDSYTRFPDDNYEDIFNNRGFQQTYHQFALTYRENYTKRIAFGVKLSYLSGIAYSSVKINHSDLSINRTLDEYQMGFTAKFKSTLKENQSSKSLLSPGFKNPGFALTASANFKFKKGWFLLTNLKDLGFIRWSKNAKVVEFSKNIWIDNASADDADNRFANEIENSFVAGNIASKPFSTPTNARLEVLLNRNFGNYHPNLFISKNIWYPGGQVALINNYVIKEKYILSLTPTYNLLNFVDVGAQYLYKTPNWEFFIGSDQLFKSLQIAKSLNKSDASLLKGQLSTGLYLGFTGKFGKLMEHPLNANFIPGLEAPGGKGFFGRLFGKKK